MASLSFSISKTLALIYHNNYDCNHLFYKWEGVIGEKLEDRKEGVIKDVPKYWGKKKKKKP